MGRYQTKRSNDLRKCPTILIVSDGLTEINYISSFIEQEYSHTDTFRFVFHPHMENASKFLNYIKKVHYKYDIILTMFARDEKTNNADTYNSLVFMEKQYDNIVSGYSNPCFEFWFLIHDEYRDTPITTIELNRIMKIKYGKNYKTNKKIFLDLGKKIETAIQHESRLNQHWLQQPKTSPAERNPSSRVGNIILKLRGLLENEKTN
ncbi:MAG: RloB domain-containing protein [Bacilli bacterium]|nr:RloB domain-containing protein [Bacilli bacterium]MBN2877272.1 RloB domain-containing protein [Bacilli bacterium]